MPFCYCAFIPKLFLPVLTVLRFAKLQYFLLLYGKHPPKLVHYYTDFGSGAWRLRKLVLSERLGMIQHIFILAHSSSIHLECFPFTWRFRHLYIIYQPFLFWNWFYNKGPNQLVTAICDDKSFIDSASLLLVFGDIKTFITRQILVSFCSYTCFLTLPTKISGVQSHLTGYKSVRYLIRFRSKMFCDKHHCWRSSRMVGDANFNVRASFNIHNGAMNGLYRFPVFTFSVFNVPRFINRNPREPVLKDLLKTFFSFRLSPY